MADDPADRRSAPRFAATFRIRLGYPDINAFLDGYAVNISKGGIYVPTKQPRERGTEVRFELLLKDGSAAVTGAGRVAWAKAFDPAKPGERYGMGVEFVALEGASEDIVQKAMAWRQ
jgi:molecular chaperone DnaK